jgi:ribonuclease BN (tRNA processing enzyme)
VNIKILGTRGEIKPSARRHSRHSGVLIDQILLFDLGEREFLNYQPKYVFITHLHPDHAYFVRQGKDKVSFKNFLYAPEKYKNIPIKLLTKTKKFNSYEITPIPTIHSLKVKSQAYLIKKGREKILYTGDMIWIEKKYHELLKNINFVITEASYLREKGLIIRQKETGKIYGHTGIPNLMKLFSRFTKHVLFTHFGTWFYKDIKKAKQNIQRLAKSYGIEVYVGYDGMNLDTKDLT